ncbi:hypothetical protein EBU58_10120, partial [bacterium]|nr:hypothetical protein [bacterium]
GGNVRTNSGQVYEGSVTISGGSRTLYTGSGDVVFNGTVDGGSQALTISSGLDLNAEASNLASLSVSRAANLGANVTSSGSQGYSSAVVLSGGDRVLTSTGGSLLTFLSTLTGSGDNLTIDGQFNPEGTVSNLTNLLVTKASTVEADVTTSGTQTYNGTVTSQRGGHTFTGSTIAFANTTAALVGDGNAVVIVGDLDLDGGASGLGSLSVSGTSNLGGNVSSSNTVYGNGTQTYTGAVTFSGGCDHRCC